jgi:hypothetical protein
VTPSHSLAVSPNCGWRERRAFEFYVQHAAQRLSAGMNNDFWTRVAPQICRTEPAVWDAIIAISALYENPEQSLDFPLLRSRRESKYGLNQIQQEALTWYSRSISGVHSQIVRASADPYIALISCVLFICIEAIQGRIVEALQLHEQGVSLIHDLRVQVAEGTVSLSKSLLLEQTIIPLFLRLGAISLSISGVRRSELFALVKHDVGTTFTSLDSARTAMVVLLAEAMLLEREAMPHPRVAIGTFAVEAEMFAKQQSLQSRLNHWLHTYTSLLRQDKAQVDPILVTYHTAASIFISTCLSPHEMVYDAYIGDFAFVVKNASLALEALSEPGDAAPPFTFEMGLGLPLLLTAIKCRDPHIRRRALGLLRQEPPIQAFFTCAPVAELADKCMELEETYGLSNGLAYDSQVSQVASNRNISVPLPPSSLELQSRGEYPTLIPEEARVCYYNVFRPRDGHPLGMSDPDIAAHSLGPDQVILEVFRNNFDVVSNTWRLVSDYIPLKGNTSVNSFNISIDGSR